LQAHAGWKAGRSSYVFYEYDEYSNLTGMDYYDPYSANNPYFENKIIPPAEYFGVYYSIKNKFPKILQEHGFKGREMTSQEMTFLMQVLYDAAMYGGAQGKETVTGYMGKTIYHCEVEGLKGLTDPLNAKWIFFNMNNITDSWDFGITILHEGFHGTAPGAYAHTEWAFDMGFPFGIVYSPFEIFGLDYYAESILRKSRYR